MISGETDGENLVTSYVTAMSSTDSWRNNISSAILNFLVSDFRHSNKWDSLSFDMWYECLPPFVIIGACIAVTGWGMKICDRLFQEGKVFINEKSFDIWTRICMLYGWPAYLWVWDNQKTDGELLNWSFKGWMK